MRCFVTGSTGYVGSKVVAALESEGIATYRLLRSLQSGRRHSQSFLCPSSGDLSSAELTEFFVSNQIDCVVHCANAFDSDPDPGLAEEMLYANFLVPAKVLNSAVDANVETFVNLASGWQLDPEKLLSSPDYVSTKESFRLFLTSKENQIQTYSIFANEIFGAGDQRKKLLNLAVASAMRGEVFSPDYPDSRLGLANVDRLAAEILNLLKAPNGRPREYVYQNYTGLTVGELVGAVHEISRGVEPRLKSQEVPMGAPGCLQIFGGRPTSDLVDEIRAIFDFGRGSGDTITGRR